MPAAPVSVSRYLYPFSVDINIFCVENDTIHTQEVRHVFRNNRARVDNISKSLIHEKFKYTQQIFQMTTGLITYFYTIGFVVIKTVYITPWNVADILSAIFFFW